MSNDTSKPIEEILTHFRWCEEKYHMAEADEQEANSATQDILHSIELEEHDYQEMSHLAKELKQVRKRRRAAKDAMSMTAPVLEWLDANRAVIKSLERLLGEVRKAEKNTEGRIYTPRTKR